MDGRPTIVPDLPVARPTDADGIRRLISKTYGEQPWNIDEARRFEKIIGLEPKRLKDRTEDELQKILTHLEKARMVLFKD